MGTITTQDGATIFYNELFERSRRVAALLHDAGLRRGDAASLRLRDGRGCPAINVFVPEAKKGRRGCPGQARA